MRRPFFSFTGFLATVHSLDICPFKEPVSGSQQELLDFVTGRGDIAIGT